MPSDNWKTQSSWNVAGQTTGAPLKITESSFLFRYRFCQHFSLHAASCDGKFALNRHQRDEKNCRKSSATSWVVDAPTWSYEQQTECCSCTFHAWLTMLNWEACSWIRCQCFCLLSRQRTSQLCCRPISFCKLSTQRFNQHMFPFCCPCMASQRGEHHS